LLLAHISDLHLNSFFNESSYYRLEFLLGRLNEDSVDHLVITGDLTDNASEKDFIYLRGLLRKYNFLNGSRLTLVVGNHDIFGGVQKAEDIFTFPDRCRKVNYFQKLNEFVGYFPESLENCFSISSSGYYPFAKTVGNILLIGMNSISAYSKLNNPFASNGEVSITQFNETHGLLSTDIPNVKFKLILIHHHFNKFKVKSKSSLGNVWLNIEKQTMKLRNKRRLFNLFNEFDVDVVLHGHLHETKEYFRKGIRFLNAGATLKNEKENLVRINYLRIDDSKIQVDLKSFNVPFRENKREFTGKSDEFIKQLNYKDGEKVSI
jgi:predicted phosphodiesterase